MVRDYKEKGVRNSKTVLLKQVRKKALQKERRWAALRRFGRLTTRILMVVLILGGSIVTVHGMLTSPFFMVKELTIKGNNHLPEEVVRRFEGRLLRSIFLINLVGVREELMGEPFIKDVFIRRELPDRVFIQIEERKPFAVLRTSAGTELIDREGVILETLTPEEGRSLPVISGGKRKRDKGFDRDLARALNLIETIGNYGYPDLKEIREIELAVNEGPVIHPVSTAFSIRCGSGDYLQRMIRLKQVVADVVRRQWPVKVIDLRFQNQVVVGTGDPVRAS
ncbi:MAG: FtsQ-type POTRA domain-containing protein [bacterium]|nr:FtsQ-type POTRA domain-containing protein [bacterium]